MVVGLMGHAVPRLPTRLVLIRLILHILVGLIHLVQLASGGIRLKVDALLLPLLVAPVTIGIRPVIFANQAGGLIHRDHILLLTLVRLLVIVLAP